MSFAQQKKSFHLAITADDYGPQPFINTGVIEAVKTNRVTSVGVLANHYQSLTTTDYSYDIKVEIEALIKAIKKANNGDPNAVGIGVHLTISSGSPLTQNKDLVPYKPDDQFQDIEAFTFAEYPRHLAAVKEEIKAQILRVKTILDEYNLPVDHISCHHGLLYLYDPYHTQLLKAVTEIYDSLPAEGWPTIRNPIPISKYRIYRKSMGKSKMKCEGLKRALKMIDDNGIFKSIKMIFDTGFSDLNRRANLFIDRGYGMPHYFFDIYYKQASYNQLKRVYRRFPSAYTVNSGELVVHLGGTYDYGIHIKLHGINHTYYKGRRNELAVLNSADIDALGTRYAIGLKTMKALKDSRL